MADSILQAGHAIEVCSFTPWVPRWMRFLPRATNHAMCPYVADWEGLHIEYPRWLYWDVGPFHRWTYKHPDVQGAICWFLARKRLLKKAAAFQPDVILAIGTIPNGYLSKKLGETIKRPFVVADFSFGEIDDCGLFPARRLSFKKILDSAARWVAVSRRMQTSMMKIVPAEKTAIIYNGVKGPSDEMRVKDRPTRLKEKVVAFCACHFYERKGVPLLVEAFARATQGRSDVMLRLGGGGEDQALIEETIHRCGAADRVELLGVLRPEEVLQNMCWSDFFVLASWDEPFATVYLEAAAAGLPIIWGNDGGINDLLRDNVHGFSVPPKNVDALSSAITRMITEPDLRKRMAVTTNQLFMDQLNPNALGAQFTRVLSEAVITRRAPTQTMLDAS